MTDTRKIERRVVTLENCEIRTEGDGKTFVGYASVFNSPTRIGSFREQVNSTAFNRALAENQDVRMLWNHDANHILGRSGKNMNLSVDDRGLRVESRLPDTSLGNDMAELVRSGIVTQMSFGFSVPKGGDEWRKGEDGVAERSLNDVDLFDVSPVSFAAYNDTTAEVRAHALEVEQREAPEDADPMDGVIETIQSAFETLEAMIGVEDDEANSGEEASEKRAGAVLSAENKARVSAAMQHLQDLMDAADSGEDGMTHSGAMSANAAKLASEKRRMLLLDLGEIVHVTPADKLPESES